MVVSRLAQDLIDPETEANYSFRVMLVGTEEDDGITTICHDHDFYELFLVTNGRLLHLINDQQDLLVAGDLVFIRPADRHSFRQINDTDCSIINLAFPRHTVNALLAYLGEGFRPERLLAPALPPVTHLHEAEKQAVMARLTQLNSIPHTEKSRIRARLRLVLAELLGRYFAADRKLDTAVSPNWLHALCRQMEDPANLRGGVPRMQALAYASPEHLSRTFRKELGCTPTQFVNDLRLTYAANLLIHSDSPIVDVSLEVGLNNLSYFYRIFKQRFGQTPAQFRARNKKKAIL